MVQDHVYLERLYQPRRPEFMVDLKAALQGLYQTRRAEGDAFRVPQRATRPANR
jgi:hypothetical protein